MVRQGERKGREGRDRKEKNEGGNQREKLGGREDRNGWIGEVFY